jgi:hypothetical protein
VKRTHGVTHWDPGGCLGCKLRTVQYGSGPAPQTLMERRWQQDMPAYARLRADHIQPRSVDGSAELEAHLSHGQLEADMRHLFNENFGPGDLGRLAETMEEVKQFGWEPRDSIDDYRERNL